MKETAHSKAVVNKNIRILVSRFNFLGYGISLRNGTDKKTSKYQMICSTGHETLGKKVRKKAALNFYKIMVMTAVLYSSDVNTYSGTYPPSSNF